MREGEPLKDEFSERRLNREVDKLLNGGGYELLKDKTLAEIYSESSIAGEAVVKILRDRLGYDSPAGPKLPPAA